MLRAVILTAAAGAVLAACEPRIPPRPLPELVKPQPLVAIQVPMLMFSPGETMTWNVTAKGFTIGRADLGVSEHAVHSRFETGKLVSAFARVHHELQTVLGASAPTTSSEVLDVDGEVTRADSEFNGPRYRVGDKVGMVPNGNLGHTLHSALGTLRAWASPDARAGFLYVLHAGDLLRIDVAQPLVEKLRGVSTLRIELRIHAEELVAVTMWLRASDRVPVRFEAAAADAKVIAELLETEA
jgi:hypothetical protein